MVSDRVTPLWEPPEDGLTEEELLAIFQPIPEEEYLAFVKWYQQYVGGDVPPNSKTISQDKYYRAWVQENRPGIVGEVPPEEGDAVTTGFLDPMAMTDYEKAAADLANRRFAWEVQQGGTLRSEEERARGLESRLEWERELSALSGPAGWIKRWKMMQMPTSWESQKRQESIQEAKVALGDLKKLVAAEESIMKAQDAIALTAPYRGRHTESMLRNVKPEELGASIKEAEEWVPSAPSAPAWLPQFAPSQTKGQPITSGQIQTPSGQQWARTPWSVREGLRGYTEFAGQRPYSDILEHMSMMQTKTPAEAGRTRWKPARQMA